MYKNIIENIGEKLGYFILNSKINSDRRAIPVNFDNAKSIGIIFNADHHDTFKASTKFIKFLSEREISVSALGFADSRAVRDYYGDIVGFSFFSKKNTNWYNKPKSQLTDEFIKKKFDILINFSLENYFPIEYIVCSSKAKFKVGRFSPMFKYYDFMIDIGEENSLENLIEQIHLYLSIINLKTR